jgi:tRNA dimethylallyltransferase
MSSPYQNTQVKLTPKFSGLKMQCPELPKPLVGIIGPTAVGKTELSLQLAEALEGEIVSADSRLFYRGMDIGTAKPTGEEMGRIPHYLIDVADPDQIWSLAVFQKAASDVIADIQQRHKLPFLVGGTGQYIRSVIEGWDVPRQAPNIAIRSVLEQWAREIGPLALHERLAIIDPQAAMKIDFTNVRRTIRALEVIFCTGKRFSSQRQQSGSPYSYIMIGLIRPREELYKRIDARIDLMVANGFLEEVRGLLEKGYDPKSPNLSAIGYREMAAVLEGKISLEEAVTQMKRMTRQFVRRQANWFKADDPNIHWFQMGEKVKKEVLACITDPNQWHYDQTSAG